MQSLSKLNHFCEATNAVYGVSYGVHVLCVRIEIERERKQWSGRKKTKNGKTNVYSFQYFNICYWTWCLYGCVLLLKTDSIISLDITQYFTVHTHTSPRVWDAYNIASTSCDCFFFVSGSFEKQSRSDRFEIMARKNKQMRKKMKKREVADVLWSACTTTTTDCCFVHFHVTLS